MDLQPTGSSSELILIETEDLSFVIKGDISRVDFGSLPSIKVNTFGNKALLDYDEKMYFKEYSDYEIIIESKNDSNIEFYHENINIRKKITPTRKGSKNLSGVINFKGDIGFTDIILMVNGRDVLVLTVEVYPSKINYKEDYEAIIRDINEEVYNLAFGFLSRTYLGAEINNKRDNSQTEFYSILNYVFYKLINGIDVIIQNPKHELIKENNICKYQSLKNSSNDTIKWLEKRPHLLNRINGRYIPNEALQTKKIMTMDTKENRFIKFILISINKRIDGFISVYKGGYKRNCDEVIINKLIMFKKQISMRLNNSFLRNISSEYNEVSLSLVLAMASGYKEVYKYYLMLQKGLNINSNLFSLSIKELSLLYEYWCFIKINSLLKKKYRLISSDFIKIDRTGINVSLKKGVSSVLEYENPKTNERFKVIYNARKPSKTVSQKPDNILSINKENYKKAYEFIFDAKYKIDRSEDYIKTYNGIGPKEEDINTMHRYRDSIVYNKSHYNKNCIFGAFVLFPYHNEEEFRNHKFYKSIDEVNIGAIPFLPSSTKLMEEFLNELIVESSYSTFERALEPIGKDNYLQEDDYKNRNVLVGSLRNKEQLERNISHNFYHTKKSNVDIVKNKIEYIALAQSKKIFGEDAGITYYGKVKSIEEVRRCDIREIESKSEDLYYKFNIENWLKLDKKIEVKGYQVIRVMYTTEYLLKNADIVTELCIKEKEEFRIWKELKRAFTKIDTNVDIGNKNLEVESNVKQIRVRNTYVIIELDQIKIIKDNEVVTVNKVDFRNKSRYYIKNFII